jgi:hypothetical protein
MNVRHFILLVITVLTSGAVLSLCGNNSFHQRYAGNILTMGECLNCHGGLMGKTITLCTGKECLYTKNHSIMHPYPPVGKTREYASVSEITQAGCLLENGKITCQSCHDLTKPPPHTIQEGSNLCTICHINLKSWP